MGIPLVVAGALALPLAAVGAQGAGTSTGTIAFTATTEAFGQGDVYVIHADGSQLRRLTNTAAWEQGVTWAPDGRSLATVRVTGRGALYRLFLDRRKPRLLYKETSSTRGILRDPAWSPDGRRIAFASTRSGTYAIWTIGLDGSLRQVTSVSSSAPTWAPNGRRLAYSGLSSRGHGTIFVVGLDGRRRRDVSHAPVDDSFPVWSPNGKWIAFRSLNREWKAHEVDSLDIVNPAGTVRERLLSSEGFVAPVAWSPASDAVLVTKHAVEGPDQTAQLFVVPLTGGRPRAVPGTSGAGSASWHR
jgi:Tol biopolymer transport system component